MIQRKLLYLYDIPFSREQVNRLKQMLCTHENEKYHIHDCCGRKVSEGCPDCHRNDVHACPKHDNGRLLYCKRCNNSFLPSPFLLMPRITYVAVWTCYHCKNYSLTPNCDECHNDCAGIQICRQKHYYNYRNLPALTSFFINNMSQP